MTAQCHVTVTSQLVSQSVSQFVNSSTRRFNPMQALSSKGRFHSGGSFTAGLEGVLLQIWKEFYGRSGGSFTDVLESLYRHHAL